MPNDLAGSFPLPPTDNQPPAEPTQEPEVKLTDEVAPDLSAPPTPIAPVPQEPAYQPPITPTPAIMPVGTSKPFPVITLLLLLISIGAIAATYFFYKQTLALNTQLTEIGKTLEQQKIRENQLTPTPTPTLEIAEVPSPASTISATITPPPTSGPTPTTIGNSTGLAFADIKPIIATGLEKYPNAQLILIVATGAESPATTIIKYWFRQTLTDKKYLYVLSEPGKELSLVDHPQLYVKADNNIPSLNKRADSSGLGLDMNEAIKIAAAACPNNFDCTNSSIKAQYIDDLKLKTILWQISFTSSSGKLFVVQINATTKKIIIQYF